MQSALELVDIRLLDHLIVVAERIMSLAERGLDKSLSLRLS
ncbi:JAB domain-containing protein [Citrobacter portucalensis]